MQAHEIDYQIFGDEMQYVEIELDPQEIVIAEAGSFMMMENGIQMETIFGRKRDHVARTTQTKGIFHRDGWEMAFGRSGLGSAMESGFRLFANDWKKWARLLQLFHLYRFLSERIFGPWH